MHKYKIIHLIENIILQASSDFTGLGLIFYNNLDQLPIESINNNCDLDNSINSIELILNKLLSISKEESICHDGFHLLNSNLELTHISYYFSTPISNIKKPKLNRGSRYRTAFYGSLLKAINCTITINSNLDAMVFIKGFEYTLNEYKESKM